MAGWFVCCGGGGEEALESRSMSGSDGAEAGEGAEGGIYGGHGAQGGKDYQQRCLRAVHDGQERESKYFSWSCQVPCKLEIAAAAR